MPTGKRGHRMNRLPTALLSALFLLLSLRPCPAETEAGQLPPRLAPPAGLPASRALGELPVPLSATEKAQARWRRDVVVPQLWQRQDQHGRPTPLAEKMDQYLARDQADQGLTNGSPSQPDLGQIKRVLAQVQVTPQKDPPGPHPRSGLLPLTLAQSIELALEHNLRIQIATLFKDAAQVEIPKAEAKFDPTVGFALWHFAPQSIFPYKGPGGRVALVVEVWFLGLLWAWVANNTGVILWTAMSHILIDFSALGWAVLFTKDQRHTPSRRDESLKAEPRSVRRM